MNVNITTNTLRHAVIWMLEKRTSKTMKKAIKWKNKFEDCSQTMNLFAFSLPLTLGTWWLTKEFIFLLLKAQHSKLWFSVFLCLLLAFSQADWTIEREEMKWFQPYLLISLLLILTLCLSARRECRNSFFTICFPFCTSRAFNSHRMKYFLISTSFHLQNESSWCACL